MSKSATFGTKTKPAPNTKMDTRPASAPVSRPRGSSDVRPQGADGPVKLTGRDPEERAKLEAEASARRKQMQSGQSINRQVAEQSGRREWLTEAEVEKIIQHAANARDKAMILICYRHGLRVSELINLRWRQIDLEAGRLQVRRLKSGEDSVHPISGRELRALRSLRRGMGHNPPFVFVTDRNVPMTRNGFAKLLTKAATKAGLDGVHSHLLRHATGFKLVNQGMDTLSLAAYLSHANVNNTKRYTKMNATRFDNVWRD